MKGLHNLYEAKLNEANESKKINELFKYPLTKNFLLNLSKEKGIDLSRITDDQVSLVTRLVKSEDTYNRVSLYDFMDLGKSKNYNRYASNDIAYYIFQKIDGTPFLIIEQDMNDKKDKYSQVAVDPSLKRVFPKSSNQLFIGIGNWLTDNFSDSAFTVTVMNIRNLTVMDHKALDDKKKGYALANDNTNLGVLSMLMKNSNMEVNDLEGIIEKDLANELSKYGNSFKNHRTYCSMGTNDGVTTIRRIGIEASSSFNRAPSDALQKLDISLEHWRDSKTKKTLELNQFRSEYEMYDDISKDLDIYSKAVNDIKSLDKFLTEYFHDINSNSGKMNKNTQLRKLAQKYKDM
ncbi:gp270 [Sphingomonas phage PAU]|uniref:gp270 n=1 Tax=Sphingomonas phage PAU TaxID=1150991 RepID=UPI0002573414|nr:gp270 [Sphingomonas phage PAU]AFF28268.1 gp270 [Sphingomonas phage PAU]